MIKNTILISARKAQPHQNFTQHISLQSKNKCCNDSSCSHPNGHDNLSIFKIPLLGKLTFVGILSFKTLKAKRETLREIVLFQMKFYKGDLSTPAKRLKTLYVLETKYFSLRSTRYNHLFNALSCKKILANKAQHSLKDLSSQAKSRVLHIYHSPSTPHPPLAISTIDICLCLATPYILLILLHNTFSLNQRSL